MSSDKKPDPKPSATDSAMNALNQVMTQETQSDLKTMGSNIWGMVINVPKDQADYK